MGELFKKAGQVNVKDTVFDVEINEPFDKETGGLIHIQSDNFRLDMTQWDFYNMAATIILAKKQLTLIKKMKDDSHVAGHN